MTVPEATQLYERICDHVLRRRMKDAFSGIGYLIQQNGFGRAYDKLTETENNYRYMIRYRLEGYPDPDRVKVENNIRRQMLELASEAYHIWMTRNSPAFYYDRIRVDRVGGNTTLPELIETMRDCGQRKTLAELAGPSDSKDFQVAQLLRQRENAAGLVFMKIFVSEQWAQEDRMYFNQVLQDPEFFEPEKALLISAVFLSLQKRFDPLKIQFLLDNTRHPDTEVSQRTLVALVLILYLYDTRIELYNEITQQLDCLFDTTSDLKEQLIRIMYQLIRSKDTDAVTRKMQEEILPEMSKMGSALQDKMRENEEHPDEFNPDWQNMMENNEFSIKMQQFSDMQLEGIDVYMSTFSSQKGYPFFSEFYNWFLPFHKTHSSLRELFSDQSLEGSAVLDAVLKSDYLCSSDKFSFCYNLLQVPAQYRTSMSNQMNADSEAFDEIRKAKQGLNKTYLQETASNRYIQDLYRFFHIHNRRKDFMNPFTLSMDFHSSSVLGHLIESEDALRRIAGLYFKNKHYSEACAVFEKLLKLQPTEAELHQKMGYCLIQAGQMEAALKALIQADLIQPDSLWTLRRIASVYRYLKNYTKALEYYRKAEQLAPDDYAGLLNTGHVLVETGAWAEALNTYFKAELLNEGSDKTYRPIAWCSFMCRKYEQAARYYQKILDKNPGIEDYLNAGHVAWCSGFPLKAVDLYKRGIRNTHTILPDFISLFEKDEAELIRHGIAPADIPALRDELLYELES